MVLTLALVWWTALGLVAASLSWVLALVAIRLVREARGRTLIARRSAVTRAMLGMLSGDQAAADRMAPYIRHPQLMAEAIMEFQGLIRGADQERVLSELCAMGAPSILKGRLRRGSREGRLVCLEALAVLDDDEAREALWSATRQHDPQVRHLAFQALAHGEGSPSLDPVLKEIARDPAQPSRLLIEVLRRAVVADTADALARLADPALPPSERALIVEALGSAGDYRLIPAIAAHAKHAEPEVRAAAVRGLGLLQHPMSEPTLATALIDPAWPVRAAAAEACGMASFGGLSEPLAALLSDEEWWVRFRAGEALARLGEVGVRRLQHAAASDDPQAQRVAAMALAERNL
ncbi:HEAT repeat domain-containing protein [Phenylobacterium sp.]|jgi:HEAT repeat protein|uniref:HEAT repeat domain-containing protein n=1 Tax=Phenylobacterium sp. TaxID=1871053 RepID=UPI00378361FD